MAGAVAVAYDEPHPKSAALKSAACAAPVRGESMAKQRWVLMGAECSAAGHERRALECKSAIIALADEGKKGVAPAIGYHRILVSRPWTSVVRRHALARLGMAATAASATYLVVGLLAARREAMLLAWNAGGMVLLAITWSTIVRADAAETRERAGADDPGRSLVYAIVVLSSSVSFLAATVLARTARTLTVGRERVLMGLCLSTVALAWTVTHTAFTLRYAHLYYREDAEGTGGVSVPESAEPTFFDFAYFAFTIGMCFQTSDCTVTSPQIRRTVLLHAVISFAYNTVLVAFVLNLIFGLAS